MSKTSRLAYLVIHTPVHIGRPLQVGFVRPNLYSDGLFEKYIQDVEKNREAGGGRLHITKREIEQWGFMPPCGARFEVIKVELPTCDEDLRSCHYRLQ